MVDSTFVGNSAGQGGAMSVAASMDVYHSIFWGNTDDGDDLQEAQIAYGAGMTTLMRFYYNSIQGWDGTWTVGEGNAAIEPLFMDVPGPDGIPWTEDDNLRLAPESALINAGDPTPDLYPYFDHDGHPRILCGRIDLGAYEFGIGDFDCNRQVDLSDFANWSDCMTGPDNPPYADGCEAFDFDIDNDVDLQDAAGFQEALDGSTPKK